MMSEERFFNHVREHLSNYAPEVPASVYKSMRRKLWMSQFLSFNATRLNLWYVLLLCGGATSALIFAGDNSAKASRVNAHERNIELAMAQQCGELQVAEISQAVSDKPVQIQTRPVSSGPKISALNPYTPTVEIENVNKPGSDIPPVIQNTEPELKADVTVETTQAKNNDPDAVTTTPNTSIPAKASKLIVPAPITDQLKSSKDQLRLLIDVYKVIPDVSDNK